MGLTVTTDDERVRETFEPGAPPIAARVEALRELRRRGVATYAFVGPILPMDPDRLVEQLRDHVGHVYVDRMNFAGKTAGLYRRLGLGKWLDPAFASGVRERLVRGFGPERVTAC